MSLYMQAVIAVATLVICVPAFAVTLMNLR